MAYQFKLPDIGEGIAEGEIVKWFVKPGDTINEDDTLLEVQND
ncbi:TPA: dihydrolipoamide acetyltransferase, partial [Enterococcus faecium]|nr:dihydrolipoamide acetyltransferase [Enterococcus faecium]HBK5235064.1 dihydrolipoamide acetyltransferase [Enterococcus faecium]HBM5582113.1 dihydrolipoamide acetyltransferase [Enterococcus faecium]